jgi:hypothetical protein
VRLGHVADDATTRVLVTLTARHTADQMARFAANDRAMYAGATDAGVPYQDALVERLPDGAVASSRVPFEDAALIQLGAELFAWIARAHERSRSIGGIHPDLVFVLAEGRMAGICPLGIEFIATAPQPMHGPRSYRVPFLAPEMFFTAVGDRPSDVFAACATLFFLGAARHPFGDAGNVRQIMARTRAGRVEPWPGSPDIGELLATGLAPESRDRPSAEQLRDRFTEIRVRH